MNTSLGTGVLQLPLTGIPPLPNPPIPTLPHMGTPYRWTITPGERKQYLQSRVGHYLEIYPNGTIQGNLGVKTIFGIIMFLSFVTNSTNGEKPKDTIAIKGLVSNLYLCMDNRSLIYASKNATSDCAFSETLKNNHNVFYHASHQEKRRKFYLGIGRDGAIKPGMFARRSQKFSQFLPVPVRLKDERAANLERERLVRRGPPPLVTPSPNTMDPAKRRKNERRRRRRRWCSKLRKIFKNPEKYTARCKHFCDLLDTMIKNYPKHKKRCERAQRRRNNSKKSRRRHRQRSNRSKRHGHGERRRSKEGRFQRQKRKIREQKKLLEQSKPSTVIHTGQIQ